MTDPVWSVILLIVIGLLFAAYIIYYILRESYLEVQNGNKTTEGSYSESSQRLR
jgi:uncharacterized membrane protein YraQ (UPF0718 family)